MRDENRRSTRNNINVLLNKLNICADIYVSALQCGSAILSEKVNLKKRKNFQKCTFVNDVRPKS